MSPKLLNILLIILPVSLYFGYIDPAYTGAPGLIWTPEASIVALQSQKVQHENALDQINLVESEVNKTYKDYLSLDKEIKEKVEIMLPDSIDQFKLRNEVTSIANKTGVAIGGLKVTEMSRFKNPNVGGYKISFSVKCNYAALKNLTESYETNKRFFTIDTIGISHYVKKDENGQIIMGSENEDMLDSVISYNVYYLRP
jgi:hypothetical protein